MKHTALIEKRKYKDPPIGMAITGDFLGGYVHDDGGAHRRYLLEIEFDIDNLEHVNFIRQCDGKNPLPNLKGYCTSTGCSCRHPDGSKGIPHCGLFKCYEADGVKRDFINQLFGI